MAVVSSVGTVNTSNDVKSVAVTTPKASVNAAASVGGSVAAILEIDMAIVQAHNGVVVSDITELSAPVTFIISTPVGVANPENYDFAMVRIHDGAVDILPDMDFQSCMKKLCIDRREFL